MNRNFGKYGPSRPLLAAWGHRLCTPIYTKLSARKSFYTSDSAYAIERGNALQEKLRRNETVYLAGIVPSTHNSGVALIEVSSKDGIRLLYNNEEERYTGIKHYMRYPEHSIEVLREQMGLIGKDLSDIHAWLAGFNYIESVSLKNFLEEFPTSLILFKQATKVDKGNPAFAMYEAPTRLGQQIGTSVQPLIGMRHHDNHAAFSYAVSPFAHSDDAVMIAVIDGFGDDGAISFYRAQDNDIQLLYKNDSIYDSLGLLYGYLSSTQGGWPVLSSEGRYMGAAAWGNNNRLTNPYYLQLRQLIFFAPDGQIYLNRAFGQWASHGSIKPYSKLLEDIIGPPIAPEDMWNPDAVLNPDDIQHGEITRERLDKAAATQLLFEDALFHMIGHLIRNTGSNKLVLTGGCALNCVANMRLLQHFNQEYYERYTDRTQTYLHLWVPPTPSDTGVAMGAAYAFALKHGASVGPSLQHAFYCGLPPKTTDIEQALQADNEIAYTALGNIHVNNELEQVADFLAYAVSHDSIVGLYQGTAETGPRALGHRSILANPCNPQTLARLNSLVKYREIIRPLAPMATLEAAQYWFELLDGGADDNYNAYNYMIFTAMARPESRETIPAVIHKDGTVRVQIVRTETDPFCYAYLKAMGRYTGVEISVNTSLNVGSPIVQTPIQAIQALKKSKGMHGILMLGDDGTAFLLWHTSESHPKDGGKKLVASYTDWKNKQSNLQVSL